MTHTYRIHNLHGPTVFTCDALGLDDLARYQLRASVTDGFPLRLVHEPSNTVVAVFHRGAVTTNLIRLQP